ncbi:hypothetical protein F3Y22_tig00110814pilonHSYRG00034 [Hibiscus syriacus]|uniref:Uncharacterized protein n=1 Tax=Hibiscus syriacus TaxID=106335 RepID=A0A6A2ZNC1_HIBSY|nr:hypothetical protein F3Y22_tig00110814pilonHSYRG00034 [Hibiscus syriacus]
MRETNSKGIKRKAQEITVAMVLEIISRSGIRVSWNLVGRSRNSDTKSESSSSSSQLGASSVVSESGLPVESTRDYSGDGSRDHLKVRDQVSWNLVGRSRNSDTKSESSSSSSQLGLLLLLFLIWVADPRFLWSWAFDVVELRFLNFLLISSDLEIERSPVTAVFAAFVELVSFESLVWFLVDKFDDFTSLVWFLADTFDDLVWFLVDKLNGLMSLVWFFLVVKPELFLLQQQWLAFFFKLQQSPSSTEPIGSKLVAINGGTKEQKNQHEAR